MRLRAMCIYVDDAVNGFRVYVPTTSQQPKPTIGDGWIGETMKRDRAALVYPASFDAESFGAALMHLASSPAPVLAPEVVG